jgi:hypothetical protein
VVVDLLVGSHARRIVAGQLRRGFRERLVEMVRIIARISVRGQVARLRDEMKSAISSELAFQRLLAFVECACIAGLAAWSTSTAMVMWSCSRAVR